MEKDGKRERRNMIALTGAAALLAAAAVNFAVSAVNAHLKNRKRKVAPGSNVRINLSATEILKLADHIIARSKEVHDAVASVPLDKVTSANTILTLAELEAQQFPLIQSCTFPKLVSASEDIRKASIEAERRIDDHVSTCSKREDVYRVIKAFTTRGDRKSSEVKRFAQHLVQEFERNGLNLTSTKREELQRLRAQIDELSMRYIRNLNDDSTFLLFHDTELVGLPPEFLKILDKAENGKYKVVLRSHHVSPILELCKVGSTRKSVAVAYGKRCEVNLSVLEKLIQDADLGDWNTGHFNCCVVLDIQLRHKLARLLGYLNFADYAIGRRMANSSTKSKEEGEYPFGIEDLPYYVKRIKEKQFDLDLGVVKQYFPVSLVISGIFKICQDLFGLRFEEVADAEVWYQDVKLFSVLDLSSGELMGYFYLDMYTREGKYGHTCVVALQNGSCINSTRQIPVALLICQLQKEANGHPGLLSFSEVVNLFHEFGHVVQHICNRASFARFSGLRLDSDFVEIPSLLLENWCYENSSLKLISGFHQDITKPIEDEICKSLKRWRCSFSALKLKQEIVYCLFDQIIHSNEDVDMIGLFKHLHSKIMLGLPILDGTNPASCFPQTAIGYEATCYSRMWSEVFAADIFAMKFRDDIFNQNAGMHFRNTVLTPGGAKEPLEILSDFLGREPSIQAFVDSKAHSV
ncbi:probable thimet oligopeptidase [Phtheirospermum japonicum]|uniref:Probable thimet oligopeptidase n=1 Tax=Phtheirospermum japonicum TaxID=374723 RepID=A0A830CEP7_9LAMI|nr:probable thimet oligopeptidase [Phtheirospermum japonicum]